MPQPSGRSPALIVTSFAIRSGWRTASAMPTRPPRLAPRNVTGRVTPSPVEPRGDQIREAERRQRRQRAGLEAAPGRAVARPARREHGGALELDERRERRPPRLVLGTGAEREGRRGDASDDDHDRRVGARARRRPRSRASSTSCSACPSTIIASRRTTRRRATGRGRAAVGPGPGPGSRGAMADMRPR